MSENCIDPAAIQEGDLMAYVDGIAGKAAVEHIHRCSACAQEVRELKVLQSALIVKLYRHSCPEPDRLLAYGHRELGDDENLAVARHLDQCSHCVRELGAVGNTERTLRHLS